METINEAEREFVVGVLDEKLRNMEEQIRRVKELKGKLMNAYEVVPRAPVPPPRTGGGRKKRTVHPKAGGVKKKLVITQSVKGSAASKFLHVSGYQGRFRAQVNIDGNYKAKMFDDETEAAEWVVEQKGLESIEDLVRE